MKTSIFIKSYLKDYEWLAYCLRSIQKFVTGYHEIVVAIPSSHPLGLTRERIVYADEWPDPRKPGAPSSGYYHQMWVKLCADTLCPDADLILFVDSDCIFHRPFDVSEMMHGQFPRLIRRPWEDSGTGVIWRAGTERALDIKSQYDTMLCHPSIYWSDTLKGVRDRIEEVHAVSAEQYIRNQEGFSEFVTMGNYAIEFSRGQYAISDTGPNDGFPRPLTQCFSWGGIDSDKRREIEKNLS